MNKLIVLLIIAVLGIAMMSSCTMKCNKPHYKTHFPPVSDTVLYKVKLLEKVPMQYVVKNTENGYIDQTYYTIGDTVLINVATREIDPNCEYGMYARVMSIKGQIPNEVQPKRADSLQ